ncbi:3-oxoadipate enol-lactonase [Rubrobacter indicoceani]|uniref:3-oxoadipate enol-lactonase n=1 Tax=Rubrobacter indicoceani TaxID=2051957 RepID=UPI000E5ADFBD|nr:3-oxoadipate enol-lactonase [Rubrobacter indicoceani]
MTKEKTAGPVKLHHTLEGPQDAPVLVFVNSIGTTYRMWDPQMPALKDRFRILRYDQRGHGSSAVPDGPYSIPELGGDLLALLDKLEIEATSVCGLSLGGMVAMWVAAEAPERIGRLALCCTSARLGPEETWKDRARIARASGVKALTPAILERWYTPAMQKKNPEALEKTAAMLDGTPGEGYAGCCEAIRAMDLRGKLPAIAAPTLVVAGLEDPSTPPSMLRDIHSAVPDSTLTIIPEAAHLANVEQPEAFNEALLSHLEPLTGGTPR